MVYRDPERFVGEYDIPNDIKDILFETIERRMKPQVVKIQAGVEVTCFTKEGIIAIRRALKKGLDDHSTDECAITIKLEKPPLYTVSMSTLNPEQGVQLVEAVMDTIRTEIKKAGGNLVVKIQPYVITHDHHHHQKHFTADELANDNHDHDHDHEHEGQITNSTRNGNKQR